MTGVALSTQRVRGLPGGQFFYSLKNDLVSIETVWFGLVWFGLFLFVCFFLFLFFVFL
jgi:hypothetical protein